MENNSIVADIYDAGIFLDNDKTNVDTVALCGGSMKTVLVPCQEQAWVSLQSVEMYEYVASLSPEGREAAMTIHKMARIFGSEFERYDKESGIQEEHVKIVEDWVASQRVGGKNKRLAALFDWDRTLTVIEGLYSFGTEGLAGAPAVLEEHLSIYPTLKYVIERWNTMTPRAVAEYYFGGPRRVKMLQNMFDYLYSENVDIFVLTYNPICVSNRRLMEDLMNVLTRGRRVGYFCANSFIGLDKKTTIQRNDEHGFAFSLICPDLVANNIEPNFGDFTGENYLGGSKKYTMKKRKNKRITRKKLKRRISKK